MQAFENQAEVEASWLNRWEQATQLWIEDITQFTHLHIAVRP